MGESTVTAIVTHSWGEIAMRPLAEQLMALRLGEKITFDPPLNDEQQDWLFAIYRAKVAERRRFKCTKIVAPKDRSIIKRFFARFHLHTMTRIS